MCPGRGVGRSSHQGDRGAGHADPLPSSVPRLDGLDLLRAIAICWVMLYHASLFGLASQDYWIVRFGWMGVDLFFVLSGFLIAGQLLRPWARGLRPDYPRFISRRLLRTLPAYLAVVALYFIFPALRDRVDIQPLWRFLTFTQNFGLSPSPPKAFSHAWSLCVEEQFYVAFPIAVALLAMRPNAKRVMTVMATVLLAGMIIRGYTWLQGVASVPFDVGSEPRGGPFMTLIYYPTWTRLDGLLAGVCAAAVQVFRPQWWQMLTAQPNRLLVGGIAGIVATTVFMKDQVATFWPSVLGYPLLSVSACLLVIAGTQRSAWIGRIALPGAQAVAVMAYSLYLSHKIIFAAFARATPLWLTEHGILGLGAALGLAGAAGAALYWTVERPFLKLRDRLDGPSRSSIALRAPVDSAP
jgi:peptidoglycan/LPS O-acetylase OafA/YrhL